MITNCDIHSDDIKRAYIIWGPAESVLQGKMKRKNQTNTTGFQNLHYLYWYQNNIRESLCT